MAERKVLNKYFPPDFDPAKLPKLKLPKDRQYVVRLMAPFNMRCLTCGEYIYKGKKFNARKETVLDEEYLGLLIFRFYIRCPQCIAEITFKTDPENTDYVCEKGATRNFQAQKMMEQAEEKLKQDLEDEEANNPMKALENRTNESRNEMDVLEKLEELRELNARHASVDYTQLLEENKKQEKEMLDRADKEDEELVKSIFGGPSLEKRLNDSDSDEETELVLKRTSFSNKSKPTDLLTEEASLNPPPSKKPKVWEKSVGKLSVKSTLQGLVKPKNLRKITEETKSQTSSLPDQAGTSSRTISAPALPKPVQNESNNSSQTAKAGSLGLLGSYGSEQSSSGSEED